MEGGRGGEGRGGRVGGGRVEGGRVEGGEEARPRTAECTECSLLKLSKQAKPELDKLVETERTKCMIVDWD